MSTTRLPEPITASTQAYEPPTLLVIGRVQDLTMKNCKNVDMMLRGSDSSDPVKNPC